MDRARPAGRARPRSIHRWMLLVSLVAVLPTTLLLLGVTAWGLHAQSIQREASLQR